MKSLQLLVVLSVFIFTSCGSDLSQDEKQAYTERGNEISQKAFKTLSSELKAQMKAGGPVRAVSFCNVNALPLTAAVSNENGVRIKRTSDKIRNGENTASERELEIIHAYKTELSAGKELKPVVEKRGAEIAYYAPIKLQGACLNCHGVKGTHISKGVDSILALKYPMDIAFNYKEGDLRGIWSITFNTED